MNRCPALILVSNGHVYALTHLCLRTFSTIDAACQWAVIHDYNPVLE